MATPTPEFILASSSPRRQQLLEQAGYACRVVVPDPQAECGVCSTGGPVQLVQELALRKATDVVQHLAAADRSTDIVLLAADTVAECQGQVLGKPAGEDHARQMLELMRGRRHYVHTGICLWRLPASAAGGPPHVESVTTTLRMDPIDHSQIEAYLESGDWEGKAGGFGYQDRLGWIHVEHGSESNVVGLPMERLSELLAAANVLAQPA